MALSLFRFIAAVGRTQVVASTLGTFTLLLVFVLGGFIVAKSKLLISISLFYFHFHPFLNQTAFFSLVIFQCSTLHFCIMFACSAFGQKVLDSYM